MPPTPSEPPCRTLSSRSASGWPLRHGTRGIRHAGIAPALTATIPTLSVFTEDYSYVAHLAIEIIDGRIEWPTGVQPPAWFATAAQALVDEEADR